MTFGMLLLAMAGIAGIIALLLAADPAAASSPRWLMSRRIAVAVLTIGLAVGTFRLIGFLFHPWSYSLIGHPTLTGGWTGRLRSPGETGEDVFLRIYLSQVAILHKGGGPPLTGKVYFCRSGGRLATYEVSGEAADGGSTVALTVRSQGPDTILAALQGRWEAPALFLTGWLRAPAGDSVPVRADMVKGRKAFFDKACHNQE
jgi:hypothetical protein